MNQTAGTRLTCVMALPGWREAANERAPGRGRQRPPGAAWSPFWFRASSARQRCSSSCRRPNAEVEPRRRGLKGPLPPQVCPLAYDRRPRSARVLLFVFDVLGNTEPRRLRGGRLPGAGWRTAGRPSTSTGPSPAWKRHRSAERSRSQTEAFTRKGKAGHRMVEDRGAADVE
jgi:hypothetical protein